MKKMSRVIALVLCALLLTGLFGTAKADGVKPKVVVTTFPLYDWVRVIAGDSVELTMLLDTGVDLHSFQPTAQDIMRIATCDVFIYVGGESDDWVDDALATAIGAGPKALSLVEALGDRALIEEEVEGMEPDADEAEEDCEVDEHIWLSLKNAQVLTSAIAELLCEVNPDEAGTYAERLDAYQAELRDLDAAYQAAADSAACKTVLFGDRFPFRYLTEDYGLGYYAAFSGCSAETEASFSTIVFLAGKLDELNLPAVLTIEGTNHRIAETIIQTSTAKNQQLLVVNSMQGTTLRDAQNGLTYLQVMTDNLPVFRQALQSAE